MRLIEPDSPKASLEQGFSYIKKGDLGKAISVMDELIDNDPYLAPAYWARALCLEYRAVGPADMDRAISDYSKSIVYSGEPSSLSYGRRGILYFKSGFYEEAITDLDKALKSDLYWAEAQFYRGRAYIGLSRDDNDARLAARDFTNVIKYMPEPFAPAHFWRAQALRLLGEPAEAVADYEKALEIDPDDALALNALAYCNEHGVGVTPSRERAEELYQRAAELDFIVAQKNLAWFYGGDEYGLGENTELSAFWIRKAANNGDAEAQNLYALRLLYGKGVPCDAYQAVNFLKLACEQNYPSAICNLADCYEQGLGVIKDMPRALELYGKAAELGSVSAQYSLGRYYYFGIGIDEDNDKAFAILKPLADDGYARAQDIVGMCYENGYGVGQDLKLAGKYYKSAYEQGHVHAATHLASRYRMGRGVKKNLTAAVKLYTEAGEKGSSYAWYALGRLYFDDKCDYDKASSCFRLAIDAGEENISVWLARSLLHGKNPKSRVAEAYSLLSKSVDEESDKLHAALFLCELEYYGFCGWPLNPEAAVKRVRELLSRDDPTPVGLSCAYYFLAQANELGIGVPRDADAAAELYLNAGKSREANGCRCFIAGFSHMLYQGVGCSVDREAADMLVINEMREFDSCTSSDIRMLYIWSSLTSKDAIELEPLVKIAIGVLREEPYDPVAAYTLYYLRRGYADADKHLSRLRRILKTASPYYRHMIERQLLESPGQPLYPILTAEMTGVY